MASNIDYATHPVPNDKPPDEYTWPERRSEIYNLIEEAGHPRNLERTQEQLGRRYGVSQRQISDDIEAIREYEQDRVGDDAKANTGFICQKAVRELMDDGEYKDAAELQLKYNNWLQDTGEQDKEPEKLEHSSDGSLSIEVAHDTRVDNESE